jgi:hypothetical protein
LSTLPPVATLRQGVVASRQRSLIAVRSRYRLQIHPNGGPAANYRSIRGHCQWPPVDWGGAQSIDAGRVATKGSCQVRCRKPSSSHRSIFRSRTGRSYRTKGGYRILCARNGGDSPSDAAPYHCARSGINPAPLYGTTAGGRAAGSHRAGRHFDGRSTARPGSGTRQL